MSSTCDTLDQIISLLHSTSSLPLFDKLPSFPEKAKLFLEITKKLKTLPKSYKLRSFIQDLCLYLTTFLQTDFLNSEEPQDPQLTPYLLFSLFREIKEFKSKPSSQPPSSSSSHPPPSSSLPPFSSSLPPSSLPPPCSGLLSPSSPSSSPPQSSLAPSSSPLPYRPSTPPMLSEGLYQTVSRSQISFTDSGSTKLFQYLQIFTIFLENEEIIEILDKNAFELLLGTVKVLRNLNELADDYDLILVKPVYQEIASQLVSALKIVAVDRNLGFFLKFGRTGGFEDFLRVVEGEFTQRQFIEIIEIVGRLGSLNVGFQNLVRERMIIKV